MSSQCNTEHPTSSHSLSWTEGVRLTPMPAVVDLLSSSTDPNVLVTARPNDRVCRTLHTPKESCHSWKRLRGNATMLPSPGHWRHEHVLLCDQLAA